MDRPLARRIVLDAAAVGVPAVVAVLGVPPFGWSTTAALVACLLLPLRHVYPPLAVLGCLWGLAGGLGWAPAIVALFSLGRATTRWPRALPWLALAAVATVTPVLLTQTLSWQRIVLTVAYATLNVVAPTVMGLLVATRANLVHSLAELDRARDTALAAQAETARAEERTRIGREIHDAVGHHITLIAVSAAALAASTREESTRVAAEQLRTLAKRSLTEVRTALGLAGSGDGHAGVDQIPTLVAGSHAAGMTVELIDDGRAAGLCPMIGRAAYRVVQESLTNAARHAPGAPVRVELTADPAALRVHVANAPTLPVPATGRAGTGLAGLAARVGALGGHLDSGPSVDGGFTVEARFPLAHPAAADVAPTKVAPVRRPTAVAPPTPATHDGEAAGPIAQDRQQQVATEVLGGVMTVRPGPKGSAVR